MPAEARVRVVDPTAYPVASVVALFRDRIHAPSGRNGGQAADGTKAAHG